ncbi:MAG: hypothetical protein ACFFCM_18690 [Promethearchaeota archaeon]
MKPIFKGIISGTAITDAHYGLYLGQNPSANLNFFVELDEKIYGIPSQLPVSCDRGRFYEGIFSTLIKKGDKVLLNCEIWKKELKIWQVELIILKAKNIYNESMEFGF